MKKKWETALSTTMVIALVIVAGLVIFSDQVPSWADETLGPLLLLCVIVVMMIEFVRGLFK